MRRGASRQRDKGFGIFRALISRLLVDQERVLAVKWPALFSRVPVPPSTIGNLIAKTERAIRSLAGDNTTKGGAKLGAAMNQNGVFPRQKCRCRAHHIRGHTGGKYYTAVDFFQDCRFSGYTLVSEHHELHDLVHRNHAPGNCRTAQALNCKRKTRVHRCTCAQACVLKQMAGLSHLISGFATRLLYI